MSVSEVSEITGFHWETIKKIHLGIIDKFLKKRKDELFRSSYKPTYLAVIQLSQFLVFGFLKPFIYFFCLYLTLYQFDFYLLSKFLPELTVLIYTNHQQTVYVNL